MRAVLAIEWKTQAIGYKNGELILNNKSDKKQFVKDTKGDKLLVVGRKTFETLPLSMCHRCHLVTKANVEHTRQLIGKCPDNYILIGGAQTYKTFEDLVTEWCITWHITNLKNQPYVTFSPNLTNFNIVESKALDYRVHYERYQC